MANEIIKLKREIRQLKFEKAIKELNEEVKKYKKNNTFGIAFARCFKRLQKLNKRKNNTNTPKSRKKRKSSK